MEEKKSGNLGLRSVNVIYLLEPESVCVSLDSPVWGRSLK